MNYFTTLQGRYPEEQKIMTTPGPLHKEHPTKLKLNINDFSNNTLKISNYIKIDIDTTHN